MTFTLNDEVARKKKPEDNDVPKDHKFVLNRVASQTLSVLSRDPQCGEQWAN